MMMLTVVFLVRLYNLGSCLHNHALTRLTNLLLLIVLLRVCHLFFIVILVALLVYHLIILLLIGFVLG